MIAAGEQSRAAFGRRSIPAKQPVMKPARRSAGDPSRLNRVAARRSSLHFGRNTPGIPPSRALSAGRLAGLGAHAGSTTGCSPRRFAPLVVALRSKYTRASSPGGGSSLTRLVSRAPRPHRENWPLSALTPLCPWAASSPWRRLRGGDQPESVIALRKSALDAVCLILSITSAIASTVSSDASTLRRTTIRCSSPGDSSSSSRRVPL